ncbi:hypothetical protein J6590_100799 [Homalodisca vitripennis]|nr:hypothetical protein J6590_100799 [Homalodisca vitripennis]
MDNETEEQENSRIRNFLNETLSDDEELEDSFADSDSSEEDVVERESVTDTDDTDADPTIEPGDHNESDYEEEPKTRKRKRGDNSGCSSGSTNIPQNVTMPPAPTMSLAAAPPPSVAVPSPATTMPPADASPPASSTPPSAADHDSEVTVADPHIIVLQRHVVRAKNNHVWSTRPGTQRSRTPARNIVVSRRKVLGDAKQAATPRECFIQLFDEDMVNKIILHTNEQMDRVRANYYTQNNTTSYLNNEEMMAFFWFVGN